MRESPQKYKPEEGTFYEKVFSPENVKVEELEDGQIRLTLKDRFGHKICVEGGRLVRIVCRLLRPWTEFNLASEVYALRQNPQELQKTLQQALRISRRGFKVYYDQAGSVKGIASEIHKQISWKKVRDIVETAIKASFGTVEKLRVSQERPNKWTYRMPLKDPNVSAWVTVSGGNNLVNGKSGIRVWSRFRTERGTLNRPACLNWCGMWQVPLNFFGIKTERLDEIEGIEALNVQCFHLSNAIRHREAFTQELAEKMTDMTTTLRKGILPIIKQSRKVNLSKTEMKIILKAYAEKVVLPKYILKQIIDRVEEETVWGFSQAVSHVRTHGEFDEKKARLPREQRRLTQNLENIAGEVLSITPTIEKLHKLLNGKITASTLTNPQNIRALKPMVVRQ